MKVLVTGCAGFIGFHLARSLLERGDEVLGLDGLTSYYDVRLKHSRLGLLSSYKSFTFLEGLLEDRDVMCRPSVAAQDLVVHLAAQAGVRYALENPRSYVVSNVEGTFNLLEALKLDPPKHFLFASSSSVYGSSASAPFSETASTDAPVSVYAATKRAAEALCHSYSHLYDIPTTALRLFTVYGPWGRPDMAIYRFVAAVLSQRPIDLYGNGEMRRDFTYVDDVVGAVLALSKFPPKRGSPSGLGDSLSPVAPYRTVNIAGGQPVDLAAFVAAIEEATGKRAVKRSLPMQPGDVIQTHGDTSLLRSLIGQVPTVPLSVGVPKFVRWYLENPVAAQVV